MVATQTHTRYITGFKNEGQKKGGPKASLVNYLANPFTIKL
jgi:hypothetical protein